MDFIIFFIIFFESCMIGGLILSMYAFKKALSEESGKILKPNTIDERGEHYDTL